MIESYIFDFDHHHHQMNLQNFSAIDEEPVYFSAWFEHVMKIAY